MYETFIRFLAVALAGSAGAVLRYVIGLQIGRFNIRFPLATFIINITGSMFLGWFAAYAGRHQISDTTRVAIAVGFVGAYTTFSTWMYESARLLDDKAWLEATANLAGSLFLGLLAVRLGIMMARWT
jgi:CrcB protein